MQEPVKAEKKVEYLELIYDLIFVFVIGRNNQLLHHTENGFISGGTFLTYVICTLAVIQIWNFTTYYINIFGRNGIREHVSLFVNMFLMYLIAEGTSRGWEVSYIPYHVAWALILLNIGVQYLIELRHHRANKALCAQIWRMAVPLLAEAGLVVLAIFTHVYADVEISWLAIVFGILVSLLAGMKQNENKVDFMHLTERAMLYVVFTFGEMIIGIAGYFEGELTVRSLYFSLMAFLIAAALFLSYETLYDHIVDRELENNGLLYMLIHVFIILALSGITAALEFMRDDAVRLIPKLLFLIGSLLLYFVCLFLLGGYAKKRCVFTGKFVAAMGVSAAAFTALMLHLCEYMAVNILLTVLYAFFVFVMLWRLVHRQKPAGK